MNHEMRTPMHAVIALSSLLQETDLTAEQRLMVETILKSSNLLATLINDVLDLSRLEDGSLQLEEATFNLHSLFREVLNLITPVASVKKLSLTSHLASDLPMYAIGDEKRLMQTILNVVGNAVKFSKEGCMSITAFIAKPECFRDPRIPDFLLVPRCDVTTASSSEECVRVVSLEHEVVFMDVCTGLDGYELAVRIHEKFTKHQDRPLIVALTGNTKRVTKENCMMVGMDGLILKPISVNKMRGVLSELLERRVLCETV
ncbi:hypothetical protein V8G54_000118 (mitochondrion) [Vigna mungo]|uniref:Ethylene receptor n=1 Tax=Vigna mungo TaxID=3915 RepID=A0AAQ3PDJ5_VIGMU